MATAKFNFFWYKKIKTHPVSSVEYSKKIKVKFLFNRRKQWDSKPTIQPVLKEKEKK